jgi:hypothetical protein
MPPLSHRRAQLVSGRSSSMVFKRLQGLPPSHDFPLAQMQKKSTQAGKRAGGKGS